MDLNKVRIDTIRKNLRDLYFTMSLILFVVIFGTLAGVDASDRTCSFVSTDDKRTSTYACVEADLDDLEELPSGAEWIEFSVSRFPKIPADAFSRFGRLRKLAFYNCDIRDIDRDAFRGLDQLEWLILYNSKIGVVRDYTFRHLPNLQRLVLDGNELVYVERQAFSGLTRLTSLSLQDNDLNCLPIDLLSDLSRLKTVDIGGNPWLCGCRQDLNVFFEKREIVAGSGGRSSYSRKQECMTEVKFAQNEIKSFPATTSQNGTILTSSGDIGSSLSFLNSLDDGTQWIRIHDININRISNYTFFRFGNSLRSLEFFNCNITEIEADAFAGLAKLEQLLLVGNDLNVIRGGRFHDLVNLKMLTLDNNRIKEIENGAFSPLRKLRRLSLNRNKLQCLSINELRKLVQLERMNVSFNLWNCNCQTALKNYLASNRIGYEINDLRCDSRPLQPNEFQELGNNIEWHETHETHETHQSHRTHETHKTHETHRTHEEIHETHQTHKETQQTIYEQTFEPGTETTATTEVHTMQTTRPPNCHNKKGVGKNSCYFCERADIPGSRFSYVCHQATTAHIKNVPSTVEGLAFHSSYFPTITRSSFAKFGENLKILKLLNCRIKKIEPGAFVDLLGLETLIINNNDLETVRESWFQGLYNLRHLSLTGNKIMRIENSVFPRIPNLVTLEINNNHMNCIGLNSLESLHYLKFMRIAENPWSCLCRLTLLQFLRDRGISYERHVFQNDVRPNEFECCGNCTWKSEPVRPSVTAVRTTIIPSTSVPLNLTLPTSAPSHNATVSNENGQCAYEKDFEPGQMINYKCTYGDISVFKQIPNDVESLELYEIYIPFLPARIFSRFHNLKKLVIRNCSLRKIDPRAFEGLYKLEELTIDDNRLTTVDSTWFRDTRQLRILSLTRNSLTEIAPNAFGHLAGSLQHLSLSENDLTCICTSILANLERLKSMDFGENKLKWRCWAELSQYLEWRHVNYTKEPNPCDSKELLSNLFGPKFEKQIASSSNVMSFLKFFAFALILLIQCF